MNLLKPMKNIHSFLHRWCWWCLNFKYMCSGILCCFCGLRSWLLLWFLLCELVQVLFLSLVIDFKFFYSLFPVTAFGLDLFSDAYLNKFAVSMVPDD